MPGPIDIDHVSTIIRETAEAEILPRYQKLQDGDIQTKSGPNDLVTAADLAAEEILTRRLRDLAPGSLVVGEEAAAKDPSVLEHIARDETVWIIDPVDGTWNFTQGRPHFAVIVAMVRQGEARAGWIHHVLDDATVIAEEGSGAYEAGRRLTVAEPAAVSEMTATLYVGPKRTPELFERIRSLKSVLGRRSHLSCAGEEYLGLARGDIHYAMFTRLLPWDHAAGHLIHAEAGGFSAMVLDERPYAVWPIDGTILYAPTQECWHALRDLFITGGEAGL